MAKHALDLLAECGITVKDLAKGMIGNLESEVNIGEPEEKFQEAIDEARLAQVLFKQHGWRVNKLMSEGEFQSKAEIEHRVYTKGGLVARVTLVVFMGLSVKISVGHL